MTKPLLFRFHRGSLADSMDTVVEIKDLEHLVNLIEESWAVQIDALKIEQYMKDDRIDWDTQIVSIRVCADGNCVTYPVGFLNQPFYLNKESSK